MWEGPSALSSPCRHDPTGQGVPAGRRAPDAAPILLVQASSGRRGPRPPARSPAPGCSPGSWPWSPPPTGPGSFPALIRARGIHADGVVGTSPSLPSAPAPSRRPRPPGEIIRPAPRRTRLRVDDAWTGAGRRVDDIRWPPLAAFGRAGEGPWRIALAVEELSHGHRWSWSALTPARPAPAAYATDQPVWLRLNVTSAIVDGFMDAWRVPARPLPSTRCPLARCWGSTWPSVGVPLRAARGAQPCRARSRRGVGSCVGGRGAATTRSCIATGHATAPCGLAAGWSASCRRSTPSAVLDPCRPDRSWPAAGPP